jgi:hypothetical protein
MQQVVKQCTKTISILRTMKQQLVAASRVLLCHGRHHLAAAPRILLPHLDLDKIMDPCNNHRSARGLTTAGKIRISPQNVVQELLLPARRCMPQTTAPDHRLLCSPVTRSFELKLAKKMQLRIDDVAFQVDTGLSFGKEIAGGSIVDMQVGSTINAIYLPR